MSNDKKCVIGRILKHKEGYGFKVTFLNFTEAKKYKEQVSFVIQIDGYDIISSKGYNE
jgi:hypothetical protein